MSKRQNILLNNPEVINENSGNIYSTVNFESGIDISDMGYKKLMKFLLKNIKKERKDKSSNEFIYSKSFYLEIFERLVALSEDQPKRMEKTLSIIGMLHEFFALKEMRNGIDDGYGDIEFLFPKEKIKMSLEGLITPYNDFDES